MRCKCECDLCRYKWSCVSLALDSLAYALLTTGFLVLGYGLARGVAAEEVFWLGGALVALSLALRLGEACYTAWVYPHARYYGRG